MVVGLFGEGPLGLARETSSHIVIHTCPNFSNYVVLAYFKKEREKGEPLWTTQRNIIGVGDHVFCAYGKTFNPFCLHMSLNPALTLSYWPNPCQSGDSICGSLFNLLIITLHLYNYSVSIDVVPLQL